MPRHKGAPHLHESLRNLHTSFNLLLLPKMTLSAHLQQELYPLPLNLPLLQTLSKANELCLGLYSHIVRFTKSVRRYESPGLERLVAIVCLCGMYFWRLVELANSWLPWTTQLDGIDTFGCHNFAHCVPGDQKFRCHGRTFRVIGGEGIGVCESRIGHF